ncbi:radical SAM domain-containing protein, partial [mine drainage metagenome]
KITDCAKNKGFITVMNTNGSLLEKKGKSLKNLDFAFVSLDYYNDYDDVIRGLPGTFSEVIRGIYELKRIGKTKVSLVTTISAMNWNAMRPMAQLASDLGVGISFNSVEQSMDFGQTNSETTPNFDVGLDSAKLSDPMQNRRKLAISASGDAFAGIPIPTGCISQAALGAGRAGTLSLQPTRGILLH